MDEYFNKNIYWEYAPEEIEKWIVERIKAEYRNGYRELVGLPVNEKDPPVKGST